MDRRTFLRNTAVLAGAASVTRLAGADAAPPIKMGLIGCGWYGLVDVEAAFKAGGVEVVGVCDADSEHLQKAVADIGKLQSKPPAAFKDYRDLLKMPELQAVIIATPPQWHALQFIAACERGLDIYCEKPLAYDIREGQAMVAAAKKTDRVIQIGFQRRKAAAIQEARKFIQDGNAGRIVQVDAQINYTAGMKDATPQAPPPSLDWDLWCGPAPLIPYSPQVGHFNWRLEKTTGHGHLVDWGIHLIDATRWILGETTPRSVTADGGLYYFKDKITTPDVLTVTFDFKACPVTWRHRIWGAEEYTPEISNGILFYGERATVFVTDNRWVVIPRGKGAERQVHEVNSDAGLLHMKEFLDCVRSRSQPGCLTADAWQSTATVQLAMIAYESASRVPWDEATAQIKGNAAAARLLRRDYRTPWIHPGPA
jgi:predicted dehydrogenase